MSSYRNRSIVPILGVILSASLICILVLWYWKGQQPKRVPFAFLVDTNRIGVVSRAFVFSNSERCTHIEVYEIAKPRMAVVNAASTELGADWARSFAIFDSGGSHPVFSMKVPVFTKNARKVAILSGIRESFRLHENRRYISGYIQDPAWTTVEICDE